MFILDSGAFTVWNQGLSIDLDKYITFCSEHPGVDYYINLDVIPGRPNDARSLTPANVESAARQGWNNYLRMLQTLPEEKVMPVFHQGDSLKWLEKYIDFGSPYIGISPANDRTTEQRMVWLEELRRILFDSKGNLKVKTHGFAVTSFRLMHTGFFYSVDSASWIRQAAYGTIYIPIRRGGEFVYDTAPHLVTFSPKSPKRDIKDLHITTLSPTVRQQVNTYLRDVLKMKIGSVELVEVPDGYKKVPGELWFDSKKKGKIVRTVEPGIMTTHQQRNWANMKFLQKANEVLPVEDIYFAGACGALSPHIECRLRRRLMSYHTILENKAAKRVFDGWMERSTVNAKN